MEIETIEKCRWKADSRHWSNFGTNSEEIRKPHQKRAFGPLSHYGPKRNLARTIVLVVVLHVLHIQMLNRDEQSRLQRVQTGVDVADESINPCMLYRIKACKRFQRIENSSISRRIFL